MRQPLLEQEAQFIGEEAGGMEAGFIGGFELLQGGADPYRIMGDETIARGGE
ncbi:hypothetical protein [Devosia ginsengisoli]|uniref:hypothetical protein n=1 Tax=Devosia ginsengisoli TaxID=400770 RepID=UPI001645E276|nr:hypothetical protein [Devosia ginsengisoli]